MKKFKVGLIGSGAREHALGWKISHSPYCKSLHVWPGHALMEKFATCYPLPSNTPLDDLVEDIANQQIDLVICGPETPLANGISDLLKNRGIPCFGPSQRASQMESSKAFTKKLLSEASIPTAPFKIAHSSEETFQIACEFLANEKAAVIKADGLAQGKGVFVCHNQDEIDEAISRLKGMPKSCSQQIVIESKLSGREVSYFIMAGKAGWIDLGFAVDYKRLLDSDRGPNTGGMGCYTPVPWLPANAREKVWQSILRPLATHLQTLHIEYEGFLYCGLMWTNDGPKVIEFNVRLGDPEAQVLAVSDPRDWLAMIATQLGLLNASYSSECIPLGPTVGVVVANEGYPYDPPSDHSCAIELKPWVFMGHHLDQTFAASIKSQHAKIFPAQGRVLTAVSCRKTFSAAKEACYERISQITRQWPNCQYRTDIAQNTDA